MTFVDEDGVVLDDEPDTDGRSSLQVARSELAGFKFRLIETVAADPKLAKAPCTEAIIVYCRFVTIDKRTMKPTDAYCSTVKLMARGKMRSKTTARLARKLLQEQGYLEPTGSSTKDGCTRYRLANPRAEEVSMHIHEAEEYLAQTEAYRKETERRKRRGNSVLDPREIEGGSNIDRTGVQCTDPNYLGTNLSSLGTEKEAPITVSSTSQVNSYQSAKDGYDPDEPFPIPENESQATAMLKEITAGTSFLPAILGYFRKSLLEGKLTPAMVEDARRLAA